MDRFSVWYVAVFHNFVFSAGYFSSWTCLFLTVMWLNLVHLVECAVSVVESGGVNLPFSYPEPVVWEPRP